MHLVDQSAECDRIAAADGAALIVDYGYVDSAAGETLQAVRGHAPCDVLEAPGEVDLTVHVDFAALARVVRGKAAAWGPVTQGAFLQRLGISIRAEALARNGSPQQAEDIATAVERLIAPDQMGSLFKVLCLSRQSVLPPPGFET